MIDQYLPHHFSLTTPLAANKGMSKFGIFQQDSKYHNGKNPKVEIHAIRIEISKVRRVSQRGLSATETICSLFLITILVILVINLFPATLLSVRYSEQRLQAEEVAQTVLAREFERPFFELALGENDRESIQLGGMRYAPRVIVSEDKDSSSLLHIKVEVRWVFRGQEKMLSRERWRARVKQ